MEAPLLLKSKKPEEEEEAEKNIIWEKLKKVASMAAPMVAVNLSLFLIQATSTMIVGHRSELSLAAIALGSSFANVSGFGVLCGMASALETLCGQAYGAGQYQKLGSYTCTSIIFLMVVSFPISLLWVFVKQLLILFHQDPEISEIASTFCVWLIPALFGYSVLQSLVRYFQSQGLIFPMVLSSLTALCFHLPFCWLLVYTFGFGVKGAALSISFSHWLNAVFLWVFMKRSRACEGVRVLISKEALCHTKIFFQFAVPSAIMICVEWLAFEVIVLLSGLLPNSKLETSLISVCLTTSSLHYNFVGGIGAAASTNVAIELGAGNPSGARASAFVAVMLGTAESAVISVGIFLFRRVWGYAFSNVEEVIDYAAEITPILSISIVMDSFLTVLSGIVRGIGWQKMGAYVNIATYYVVGIPISLLLCFVLHFKGKGLWIGLLSGSTLQNVILFLVIGFTNWTREATKARERIVEKTVRTYDSLVA